LDDAGCVQLYFLNRSWLKLPHRAGRRWQKLRGWVNFTWYNVGAKDMQDAQKLPLVPTQLAALLQPQLIRLDLQAREKLPALRELLTALQHIPALPRPEAFFREVLARERITNTGLGNGLAMPHARTDLCADIVIAVGRSAAGIDYDAPDGKPVHLLFMIGTPQRELTRYHQLVVGLARMLNHAVNRERLLAATDAADFIRAMGTLRC